MRKLNLLIAASLTAATVAACSQSPTAATPEIAPRFDGGHGFGPGHNAAPAGSHMLGSGAASADGGHGFGSGHLTGGTTVESDTTGRGHGFGPGH